MCWLARDRLLIDVGLEEGERLTDPRELGRWIERCASDEEQEDGDELDLQKG